MSRAAFDPTRGLIDPQRRRLAAALGLGLAAAGCASPIARLPTPTRTRESTAAGTRLLAEAAEAHGATAFDRLVDVNVRYEGEWFPRVASIQPVLVDAAFRGTSEERYLLPARTVGQTHRGPGGVKQVVRWPGYSRVWYNGVPNTDREKGDAAELVVDCYQLFLFGPLFIRSRAHVVETAGAEVLGGEPHDLLLVTLTPGFGVAALDRVLCWVSRRDRTFRRVRFSIDGLRSTRGAVVEVDTSVHVERGGVRFPTRFFERVVFPLPLDAHTWRMTGLDLDRGYGASDLWGSEFTWKAADPARPLAP
jgi:hypothetical protein